MIVCIYLLFILFLIYDFPFVITMRISIINIMSVQFTISINKPITHDIILVRDEVLLVQSLSVPADKEEHSN